MFSIFSLFIGFSLDLCFGDPQWMPHPIRFIGWLITKLEKTMRRVFPATEKGERRAGTFLAVLVLLAATAIPAAILIAAHCINPYLRLALESIFCYQLLATKSLRDESMKVYRELKKGDLKAARTAVSMIVGRDTDSLLEEGVAKAAIETVAENTSDGILAPMLYMALGGAALGFFYKAANTMDSMIGYKNDVYINFGRTAARLDDVLNYIPSRLSACLMILSAYLLHMDGRNAIRVFCRDRFNHASPNSAQTEAVCAGALRIQLAGDAYYFGKLHQKKTIGDALRPVEFEDIKRSNNLLYMTSFVTMVLIGCLSSLVYFIV